VRSAGVLLGVILLLTGPGPLEARPPDHREVETGTRDDDGGRVDRWHRERGYYGIEEASQEKETLKFALYPGIGVQVGAPGTLLGLGEIYVSLSDGRSFSLFGGVGVEGRDSLSTTVVTLGWGGVRRVQVAGRQRGFFGAFLRGRWANEAGEGSLRRSFSVGSEVGGGHLSLALEFGGAQDHRQNWRFLVRAAVKVVWSIPLAL